MFKYSVVLVLAMLAFSACQSEKSDESVDARARADAGIDAANKESNVWAKLINAGNDSVKYLYAQDAIEIDAAGNVVQGRENIGQLLKDHVGEIQTIQSIYATIANSDSTYEYEISTYSTRSGNVYKQIIIWNIDGASKIRELVFTANSTDDPLDISQIDTAREQWMALCNAHDAAELVKRSYTADALYYNHKPLVKGHEEISNEYQYMNRETYQLTLTPLEVETVNENTVFEIGQCSGSYEGKYVLVWQKTATGNWLVSFDSNI